MSHIEREVDLGHIRQYSTVGSVTTARAFDRDIDHFCFDLLSRSFLNTIHQC